MHDGVRGICPHVKRQLTRTQNVRNMCGMNGHGSAVVQTLEQASREAWKRYRQHYDAGTANTPEGIAAHEEAKLAGSTWLSELFERAVRVGRAA